MDISKFIVLKENVQMHITPEYCILINSESDVINFFNKESITFFKECNGEKRFIDVVTENFSKEWERDKGSLKKFLLFLYQNEWIDLLDKPFNKPIAMKGSSQYFVPIHASIELTKKCNFDCFYCYNSHLNEDELSTAQWIQLLKRLAKSGMHTIELTGGEPTLRDDFWTIFESIKNDFKRIAILTNGSFDETFFNNMLYYSDYIHAMNISLDAVDEDLFNRMTSTKGYYQKVLNNVNKLSDNGFLIRIASVLTPENKKDIINIAKYVWENKLGYFSFSPALPFGKSKLRDWEKNDTNKDVFNIITLIKNTYPNIMQVYSKGQMDDRELMGNCGLAHKNITVSPSGKIRACTMLEENEDTIIGDCKTQSLEEIYSSPKMKFYQNLKSPKINECKSCRYAFFCVNCPTRPIAVMKENKKICHWGIENNLKKIYKDFEEFTEVNIFEKE